jgi:UDP-GlcNAc:undecaprenyl-phosphate GlcNAc-1-phosphate transferase
MLINYLPGCVALLVGLAALPGVKRLARSFSLYDAPGPLKIHGSPIPRLGGIAMFAGFLCGIALLFLHSETPFVLPTAVFAIVWAVGLADDLNPLSAYFRFAVQIGAGSLLWLAGWRLQWFSWPLADLAATCLFVAFLINAMNLLDGMDGLAASVAAVACLGFVVLSAGSGNVLGIFVAGSLLGACVAVLFVNAPPATMFMGDSGSTLLGVVLAFLSLNWIRSQANPASLAIPLIVLSVPLADASLAILRRVRSHQGMFSGDRRHFYDILSQRGWSTENILRLAICVSALLVLCAWSAAHGVIAWWMACGAVLCSVAASAFSLGSLQAGSPALPVSRQETPIGSAIE